MFKTFSGLLVLTGLATAQHFSLGLKVGAPITDALSVQPSNVIEYTQSTNRYVIGPYVELNLPLKFSVEVDALYRSYDFTKLVSGVATNTSVGSWEFPILAKYKLWHGPVKPYLEGGLALSHLTNIGTVPELIHRGDYGVVLGAGLEIHALLVRITPEFRYDGFVFRNFNSTVGDLLQSNRNQAMFLVGIGF